MEKPYWVYVLYSDSADRFYSGISEDPDRRLESHNDGKSRWTARHMPWRIVYRQCLPDITEARRFENRLKRQRGGHGFFALTGLDPGEFGRSPGS